MPTNNHNSNPNFQDHLRNDTAINRRAEVRERYNNIQRSQRRGMVRNTLIHMLLGGRTPNAATGDLVRREIRSQNASGDFIGEPHLHLTDSDTESEYSRSDKSVPSTSQRAHSQRIRYQRAHQANTHSPS